MITNTLKISDSLTINVIDDKPGDYVGYRTSPNSGLTVMVSEHTLGHLEEKLVETWLNKRGIEVINEKLMIKVPSTSRGSHGRAALIVSPGGMPVFEVVYENYAAEYGEEVQTWFKRHPETKPWHDAQPGEVWLITVEGEKPEPMIATTYGTFTAELSEYSVNDEFIITGCRIWAPEGDDDDDV